MPDDEQKVQEITDSVKAPAEPNVGMNNALDETLANVAEKIDDAGSILVTLSKNPSVDEISAALGLTLLLDRMGKHATAIYSGKTPDVIQFLEPERTFETNTDSLQDFIISLNKDKADHLRYKIEGDFVRVYITPYKTKITPEDLEYSEGEVNVDLVICLNVQAVEDLDAALAEHGRIMHDAGVINISNSIPGRIGGLEWNDGDASSVSEMIVKLMDKMGQEMTKDIATALLTGIMAETERFSNEKTSPSTMTLASELMKAGADQQLVAAHVMPEQAAAPAEPVVAEPAIPEIEPGSIEVKDENIAIQAASEVSSTPEITPEQQLEQMISSANAAPTAPVMEELANAVPEVPVTPETSVASEVPVVPVAPETPVAPVAPEAPTVLEVPSAPEAPTAPEAPVMPEVQPNNEPEAAAPVEPMMNANARPEVEPSAEEQLMAAVPTANVPVDEVYEPQSEMTNLQDGVVAPLDIEQPKDYGAMMEEALAEDVPGVNNPAIMAAPVAPVQPEVQPVAEPMVGAPQEQSVSNMVDQMVANAQPYAASEPAASATLVTPVAPVTPVAESAAPVVSTETVAQSRSQPQDANPVMQAVPVPPQGGVELPPPPTPPIDISAPATPSLPPVQPPAVEQVMQQQTQTPAEVVQPVQSVQPVEPIQPQDTSAALGIPESPAGVEAPAEPIPPVQDPGAFKIPGM